MRDVMKCRTRGCHTAASGIWLTKDREILPLCAECGFNRAVELVQSFTRPTTDKPMVDSSAFPRKPNREKLEAIKLIERSNGETVKTFIYRGDPDVTG